MRRIPLAFENLQDQIHRCAGTERQQLVAILTCRYQTSRITCFGILNGCPGSSHSTHTAGRGNHYFILVETKELYPESGIQEYLNHHFTSGKAFVLAHHRGKVREMLETGHRFYSHVRRSGILLFADEPAPGLENLPFAENWFQEAELHFRNHYGMAESFWRGAAAQLETGQLRVALFLLHQAMEQACIGLIRVFLGYRANFHNLGRLLELCSCFIRPPAELFPRNSAEERRRFRILCRSYTEARYQDEFPINAGDYREILNAVGIFVRQTKAHCLSGLPLLRECLWVI